MNEKATKTIFGEPERLKELLLRTEMITVYFLIVLIIVTSIFNPSFFSVGNFLSMLKQYSFYAICGVGLTYLMIMRAFDMSLGNTVALPSCIAAILMRDFGVSFWTAALILLILATCCGLMNGILHGVLRITAFMATLGTCYIYKGLFWVLSGQASVDCSDAVAAAGIPNEIAGVPISVWVLIILAVIGHVGLKYTKFGRSTYFIGNNLEFAREIGISDAKVKLILFGCLGLIAGICGVSYLLTYGTVPTALGSRYEFYVNAGTIIGGCSVYGGRGSIIGSLIGTAVMTVAQFALRALGATPGIQSIVTGMFLLVIVLLDIMKERKKR